MGALNWFKGLFSVLMSGLKDFFHAALPLVKQILIAQLKDVAMKSVARLNAADLSNEEKRSQAFNDIKQYAINSRITATDSLINLVLELAVQTIKK